MVLYNFIVCAFFIYYTYYFLSLTKKENRQSIQHNNKESDKLRKIPVKTLEEQKAFLNLKYPKKEKYVFRWKHIPTVILHIGISVALFYAYYQILTLAKIDFTLFWTIALIIVAPIIINLILKRFNVEKNDMMVFITGK